MSSISFKSSAPVKLSSFDGNEDIKTFSFKKKFKLLKIFIFEQNMLFRRFNSFFTTENS